MSMGTDQDSAQVDPTVKASGISLLKGIVTLLGGASGATSVWGATSDAAVTTDTTGTISGKLRGLVKWAFERMPASLGQKAKAASFPVTLASDEDLLSRLGEVQASPTSNTVLDRLKALLTGIVLAAGTAIIGKVGIDQTTPGTTDSVSVATAQGAGATIGTTTDAIVAAGAVGSQSAKLRRLTQGLEDLKTLIVLGAGTNSIGTVQPGNTANTTPWLVTQSPAATGGLSLYRNINLVATGVSIKGSAGQVKWYYIANNAATARFVKLYDKASAPTVGTDTPVLTLEIPSGSAANVSVPDGLQFTLGIGIGATQLVADNDTTAPSANDLVVNIGYK